MENMYRGCNPNQGEGGYFHHLEMPIDLNDFPDGNNLAKHSDTEVKRGHGVSGTLDCAVQRAVDKAPTLIP